MEKENYSQRFTQDQIRQARQTNIVEYLSDRGVQLEQTGANSYRLIDHDSLVITDNMFNWFSKGVSGNALDFVQVYYNLDFKSAMAELLNNQSTNRGVPKEKIKTVNSFNFKDFTLDNEMAQARAYLSQIRKIDIALVDELINKKLIYQEKNKNNIVFPIYENNDIVGAELCGTLSNFRFKGVAEGSKYGVGYNVRRGDTVAIVLKAYSHPSTLFL